MYFSVTWLLVILVHSACCSVPVFLPSASDHLHLDFSSVRRHGETQTDYSRIEITAQPRLMVEDPEEVDRVTVEMRVGGGGWREVEVAPKVRAGSYRWTVEAGSPCEEHRVRLRVHGQDGSQQLEVAAPLAGASTRELVLAQFTPSPPTGLQVDESSGSSVLVSWSASACAQLYEVTYERLGGGETFSQQVASSHLQLSGLESCTEYEIRVTALLDQQYSEEATTLATTSPNHYAAKKLEPLISTTTDSVTAQWQAFEKLSCVKK